MVDTDEIRYSFWLEKELEKNVKRLAGNVSRGCKSRHDAYKVRGDAGRNQAAKRGEGGKRGNREGTRYAVHGANERTDSPSAVYSDCKGV